MVKYSMKIWVNKASSFQEAEEFDLDYYLKMGPRKRLALVQELRERSFKIGRKHENRKRLRRVLRIIKQTQS